MNSLFLFKDWVPIIARDVQRQRRQAPQAPFSNAYLSGMPSKRRKIMTNGSPVLLGQSQSALSDILFQAISNANVQPLHNIEEVKKDASQDVLLQSSFNEHMKNAIQERLHRDLDYCSERFPNAEKYFNIDHI
ncbi:Large proline-rich protein BAG6, partial [Stegodyphus mimosarum]